MILKKKNWDEKSRDTVSLPGPYFYLSTVFISTKGYVSVIFLALVFLRSLHI
jgi:hypothetical protein